MPDYPTETEALEAVKTLIRYIGDDPQREGLQDTPSRVLKAWRDTWGYGYRNHGIAFPMFDRPVAVKGGAPVPAMVIVGEMRFASTCEHHLAPFFGTATIGYIPGPMGKLGLSKFARIIDHFARKLQIQERLTDEIADFIAWHVSPDVAVSLRATHTCMSTRGVKQFDSYTTTSALRGEFEKPEVRAEFYAAIR